MPISAMTHIQKTAPGPPAVIATATPAMLPPPTRPPTDTKSASRALILVGSLSSSVPLRTLNIRLKKRNCTKPLAAVKKTPRTTRNGISAQPHVRSLIAPKIVSRTPISAILFATSQEGNAWPNVPASPAAASGRLF